MNLLEPKGRGRQDYARRPCRRRPGEAEARVLWVHADAQGSALDWAASRQGDLLFPVAGLPRASIHKELPSLAKSYEIVVIDGPPRVYDVARSAIMARRDHGVRDQRRDQRGQEGSKGSET